MRCGDRCERRRGVRGAGGGGGKERGRCGQIVVSQLLQVLEYYCRAIDGSYEVPLLLGQNCKDGFNVHKC